MKKNIKALIVIAIVIIALLLSSSYIIGAIHNLQYSKGTPHTTTTTIKKTSSTIAPTTSLSTSTTTTISNHSLQNTTSTTTIITYSYIYNGNFSNDTYTGWTTTGAGFQSAPLNLTYADQNTCYLGSKWQGNNGTYFATTFNCGLTVAPGNLTSSYFATDKADPFLNFQIISPDDSLLYVEILYNNTPEIVAHYDTYNSSFGGNASSTFRNASISLAYLYGKSIRIRVVADTLTRQRYISVGDFRLSSVPNQQAGILTSLVVNNTG